MTLQEITTTTPRRIPGEPGFWIVIFGDLTLFAILFNLYMHQHALQPKIFAAGRAQLHPALGLANTIVLLTASLCVWAAVRGARDGETNAARVLLMVAIGCGFAFVGVKSLEWHDLYSSGARPATNDFFTYYFILTGIHFIHVLVGLVVLVVMRTTLRRGLPNGSAVRYLEAGGCFWHLVDLLWIALFAVLYLLHA